VASFANGAVSMPAAAKAESCRMARRTYSVAPTTDSSVAIDAASAIGELGPKAKAAAPQLVAALKHPKLRFTAANTLGQIGVNSPEAITVLIDLLKNDPAREARRSAAGALGAFGPAAKAAIPALGAALKGDVGGGWWVAADALGKIGGAEVVPILMEALVNPDPDIRLTSMRGLGKLGVLARPALKALEKARQEDPRGSNRAAAAEAVRKIKQASTPVNDIPHSANP